MADFAIARAAALEGVPHGFFGSAGGAHQFGYGGPGELESVRDLRSEAANAICPGGQIAAPHQVHSPDVVTVEAAWPDETEARPVADAVVTDRPGIVLAIVTADCAPVLFADREAGVIGAAHAGWRGAAGGVLGNTIKAMEQLGASCERINAAIGPTIAQKSYEVDAAFRDNFTADDDVHFVSAPWRGGAERWLFDLPGYVLANLRDNGIGAITDLAQDTFADPSRYFSYRRACQNRERNYGRQISMIALS